MIVLFLLRGRFNPLFLSSLRNIQVLGRRVLAQLQLGGARVRSPLKAFYIFLGVAEVLGTL